MPLKDMKINNNKDRIAGVGSALVDILLTESDDFLAKTGAAKGGMTLTDENTIENLLAKTTVSPELVPGGSACNTIIGLARLGAKADFIGKRGNDKLGNVFENGLKKNLVNPSLKLSDSPTGRVLSIITPDAQRSMFTFLGASSETKPEELTPDKFSKAAIVHLEGYLLFNRDLMFAALKAAKTAGACVSLDLASFTVVESSMDILEEIIRDSVDIVLSNEDEAAAFTGTRDERKALEKLALMADVAVVKKGKRGSLIACEGKTWDIGIMGDGRAKDTTGAGDLWASGFLFGLLNGMPIEKCGRLAAACGYEVCQVIGAGIPDAGWERIKALV
jgi:sugar/nucleoside kinase (ribokinase family)